ncbi:MAG: FAD-dependent oxidoreductase [Dehalococcoidia bacterium]
MLEQVRIADQIAAAKDDRLRVLVAGAGVAGITVAQVLRREGLHPVLVERAAPNADPGYMLALMPMVDPVFEELGVRDDYRARSVRFHRYGVRAHTGQLLRVDNIESVLARFGEYRGISRAELIASLSRGGCSVAFNTTITTHRDSPAGATVTLATTDEPVEATFDLVIVAEGMYSTTRALLLGPEMPAGGVDTRWGGWVAWIPADAAPDLGEELWGAGFFIGIYPVRDKLGVFVGGPRTETAAGPAAFGAQIRRTLRRRSRRIGAALDAIVHTDDVYFWPLNDCRAPVWAKGHAVLLGDAAAGFLPTAGIGAGMAMESAWVLGRMLRRARPDMVPRLLQAYEAAQRPRVEEAQDNSRLLAKLVFQRSSVVAVLRDIAMRLMSVQAALKPIQRLLASGPKPDQIAARVG